MTSALEGGSGSTKIRQKVQNKLVSVSDKGEGRVGSNNSEHFVDVLCAYFLKRRLGWMSDWLDPFIGKKERGMEGYYRRRPKLRPRPAQK